MRTVLAFFLISFLLLPLTAAGQGTLIGHWPLQSDADDITGQMPPMQLSNAPFQNNGIYCNGIYSGSGNPDYCIAETPVLPISLFQGFTVSFQFMVGEYMTQPVLMGGVKWRWCGLLLSSNGTMSLWVKNSSHSFQAHYSLNVWHDVTLTGDSSAARFGLYLDQNFIGEVQNEFNHDGNERERLFGTTHYGLGWTFKGYFRDLKIWLGTPVTSVPQTTTLPDEEISLAQNFPNPAYEHTVLRFTLSKSAHAELEVHNTLGEKVATLHSGYFDAGEHTAAWSTAAHPPGVYFYRLRVGDRTVTKMMQVIR